MKNNEWILTIGKNDIYLNNMSNLKNCISVCKNKGYGTQEFYVIYNNVNIPELTLSELYNFIDLKFKGSITLEIWNAFVSNLKNYQ